jgi:hypothetical protein
MQITTFLGSRVLPERYLIPGPRVKNPAHSTPANAFEEVLEMLRETQSDTSTTNTENLKQVLAKTQKELAKAKQTTDTAERERDEIKKDMEQDMNNEAQRTQSVAQSLRTIKEDLTAALAEEQKQHTLTKQSHERDKSRLEVANAAQHREAKRALAAETLNKQRVQQLNAKDKKLKDMTKEVKKLTQELAVSQDRETTVNGQTNRIGDEMRTMRGNGPVKRQAESEANRSQSKKVKIEQ